MPDHHEMTLRHKFPTEAELWDCPTCGRCFVFAWAPGTALGYHRVILIEGQAQITHTCSRQPGLSGGPLEQRQEDPGPEPNISPGLRQVLDDILNELLDDENPGADAGQEGGP
jgi:hypothetical protein